MKVRIFCLIACLLSPSFALADDTSSWFGDLYLEGNYLGRSDNFVGFGHLRAGRKHGPFEFYGAVRGTTDTKSDPSPLGQIFNDNFIFAGAGADYLVPVLPGFRLRGQIGASFNLQDRPGRGEGFDFQTGLITFHEGKFGGGGFGFENYGEALYIHRYENLLIGNQFRVLYRAAETINGDVTYGAYPILMGVLNFDSEGIDFNRFVDLRAGVRFQARAANWVFSLTPEYVAGKYVSVRHDSFNEFRILAVAYAAVF